MTRGGYRAGKSSGRSKTANPINMPSVPTTAIEQGSTSFIPSSMPTGQTLLPSSMPSVQTLGQSSTPIILETSPLTPNQSSLIGQSMNTQSNPIIEGTSTRRNIISEADSSSSHARILVFMTSAGLEPSKVCSSSITLSFRSEVDPNGINWKGVSKDVRDGYFGEFRKFYWDASISDIVVKQQWLKKAALCYKNFISNIKKHRARVQPEFVNDHVWERWMELWGSDECIKKSEKNSKNRCGGGEVAAGTHTGGSITIREHRRKLAIEMGRDPTPSELHLYVHTHGHDGKSFVGERSRLLHEKYEEIVREKRQSQSDIDQLKSYYQAAEGVKKKRIFGLGSEAKGYFGTNLCTSNASTSVPPSISQSIPAINLEEFVKKLIPALNNHFLPVVIEHIDRVQEVVTPTVPDPPPTNGDEVDS